jgi:hypothetical protein
MVKKTKKVKKRDSIWPILGITEERGKTLQAIGNRAVSHIIDISMYSPRGISATDTIKVFDEVTKGMNSLEKTTVLYYSTRNLIRHSVTTNPFIGLVHNLGNRNR